MILLLTPTCTLPPLRIYCTVHNLIQRIYFDHLIESLSPFDDDMYNFKLQTRSRRRENTYLFTPLPPPGNNDRYAIRNRLLSRPRTNDEEHRAPRSCRSTVTSTVLCVASSSRQRQRRDRDFFTSSLLEGDGDGDVEGF